MHLVKVVERKNFKSLNTLLIFLGGFVFLGIILFLFLNSYPNQTANQMETCGDGTFFGTCSLSKPYYCDSGKLIENVSFCGCPINLEEMGGKCSSRYYTLPKERTFSYILNGKNKSFKMVLYGGMANYTDNLPKSILYKNGQLPKREDFKMMKIDNELQKVALMPLVIMIQNLAPTSKEEQAKIAIRLVQNIPYSESKFSKVLGGNYEIRIARYPYQVLYENEGSCEGKSELLTLLLKEIGYGTTLFYYQEENHEAVGIRCPLEESLNKSGYCFIEATMPSPVSYSEGRYFGLMGSNKLASAPKIILISQGLLLEKDFEEYKDAKILTKIINHIDQTGKINLLEKKNLNLLRKKYGLLY